MAAAARPSASARRKAPKKLNDQQRIGTTMRQHKNLHRVDVGAVVPRAFNLAPLPAPILLMVPACRGYLYVVVGNDLLIVHPRHQIVALIPA